MKTKISLAELLRDNSLPDIGSRYAGSYFLCKLKDEEKYSTIRLVKIFTTKEEEEDVSRQDLNHPSIEDVLFTIQIIHSTKNKESTYAQIKGGSSILDFNQEYSLGAISTPNGVIWAFSHITRQWKRGLVRNRVGYMDYTNRLYSVLDDCTAHHILNNRYMPFKEAVTLILRGARTGAAIKETVALVLCHGRSSISVFYGPYEIGYVDIRRSRIMVRNSYKDLVEHLVSMGMVVRVCDED